VYDLDFLLYVFWLKCQEKTACGGFIEFDDRGLLGLGLELILLFYPGRLCLHNLLEHPACLFLGVGRASHLPYGLSVVCLFD
jgi:hypothetical protein